MQVCSEDSVTAVVIVKTKFEIWTEGSQDPWRESTKTGLCPIGSLIYTHGECI